MSDARHKVELEFADGVLTAKLICPPEGMCSEHEGQCDARDWFDNVSVEEILEGRFTVPVAIDWPDQDEGPKIKTVVPEAAQRIRTERAIVGLFIAQMPETLLMLNAPAVTEQIEGVDAAATEEGELPLQEVYDRHQVALDWLVSAGVLQSITDENWQQTVYTLSKETQERLPEQVFEYLSHKAAAFRITAERGDGELTQQQADEKAKSLELAACMVKPEHCK